MASGIDPQDGREVITTKISPVLLQAIFDIRCPWTLNTKLDIKQESQHLSEKTIASLSKISWPALRYLSTIGPDTNNVPDLMTLLPPPGTAQFPLHALALVWLLDQAPRLYCSEGTNVRWVSSFFDLLAQRLTAQLRGLPEEHQPFRREQWTVLNKYTNDHWLVAAIIFLLPSAHSEIISEHLYAMGKTADMRIYLFSSTGIPDPYGDQLIADALDHLSFSRWIRAGKPKVEGDGEKAAFFYHQLALKDIHLPILQKYGRYPYRNGATGRDDTEDEIKFLEDTRNFEAVAAEVAKAIKEDVRLGRWTSVVDHDANERK